MRATIIAIGWAILATAPLFAATHHSVIARKNAGGGGFVADYVETFDDATNADLGVNPAWIETGAPDWNQADPDAGGPFTNECLLLAENADEVYLPVTASGTYYAFFLFRWDGTFTDGRAFFTAEDSSGNVLFQLRSRVTGGPVLQGLVTGGSTQNGTATVSALTSYYIWVEVSSTDNTMDVFISTDGTKGAADISIDEAGSQADIARLSFDSGATSYDIYVDEAEFDATTAIGAK